MGEAADDPIGIRVARRSDEPAIMALVPRLIEFGPPPWRDREQMVAVDRAKISKALSATGGDPLVLVAVAEEEVAGFIHLHSLTDHYRDRPHGHISDIVVAPAFEGRGVGRRLVAAAQDWAQERGFSWLTLSVFEANRRAAALYAELGFGRDVLRMVKPLCQLRPPAPGRSRRGARGESGSESLAGIRRSGAKSKTVASVGR